MTAGEFDKWWGTPEIKNSQIEVGVGIVGIELDGSSKFLLGGVFPPLAARGDPEIVVRTGILVIIEGGLDKCGEGFLVPLLLEIIHAKQ